jgi:hypothetical protein
MKITKYAAFLEADVEKFKEEFKEYIEDCFENNRVPHVAGMCKFLKISTNYLTEMSKWNLYRDTVLTIKTWIESDLIDKTIDKKIDYNIVQGQLKAHHGHLEKLEISSNINVNLKTCTIEEIEEKIKENEMLEMKLKSQLAIPKGE